MDRLLAMQTFVRVAETGSFSAVARELNSTQSAVSKQVAALEKYLGARLLLRTTRSLALTDDGQRYFEEARRLVAEVQEAESLLQRGEQQLCGWLRVAAPVGFGRSVLMPHLQRFLARHAGVRIDLRLHDGFIDLVEQGIDVALRIGELRDSGLLARRIATLQRKLLVSRRYLESLGVGLAPPAEPADLARHNCIVYTELAMRDHWLFPAAGPGRPEQTVQVQGNLQTNSSEVIRAAVLAGMGICYGPAWLFADELLSGEVQVLLPEWPPLPMPVQLVSARQRRQSAKVRAFGDFLQQALGDPA